MELAGLDWPRSAPPPMPIYHDELAQLAAQLHAASLEQAADHCPHWSVLSRKAATILEAMVEPTGPGRILPESALSPEAAAAFEASAEPNRSGHGLRDKTLWARFRRWLWWVLNPENPR
jgi:hypothetical protein